jgi:hypothetical protein
MIDRIKAKPREPKNRLVNVDMAMEGENTLLMRIDLRHTEGKSKSGKSMVIASTGGFVWSGDVGISVNIIRMEPKP